MSVRTTVPSDTLSATLTRSASPGRAALAVSLPILTVAVAVGCLFFGAMLVSVHEPSTFAD